MSQPLLFEIGAEELPSSFVDGALESMPKLLGEALAAARIEHGAIRAFGTPRRLAVHVAAVADRQKDLDEEVVGPPEGAAFKDGKPTRAAEAFAEKLGIGVGDLAVQDFVAAGRQKAGRFLVGRRREGGRPTQDLLGPMLEKLVAAIPFRKSMRWGAGEATFGRPVQWLVALYGDAVVPVRFAGLVSGRETRGHRFLAPAPFDLPHADSYLEALRGAKVLADRQERAETMLRLVEEAAKARGADYDREPALVDENVTLVEWPHIVVGGYEERFLQLPASVIRSVARGHQKYFCIQTSEDDLEPAYVAVVNTAEHVENVVRGNDRVMRARLSDANFFFEEDRKIRLDDRLAKLEGIVFHVRLGTVRAKVARIERLVGLIADAAEFTGEERMGALRAAHLCKADLVSLMVGEFPELQGHMGRAYAKVQGETPAVADAVRDHYRPLGASDGPAESPIAAAVALADRLDTLAGCLAVGLLPSGAADPFALRRACLSVQRTLLERPFEARFAALDLDALLGHAFDGFEGTKLDLDRAATVTRWSEFSTDRLRGLLAAKCSGAVAEAVLSGVAYVGGRRATAASYPVYTALKAEVLEGLVQTKAPWLDSARTVAKRLSGIAKDAAPALHGAGEFTKDSDKAIVALVERIDALTQALVTKEAISAAYASAAELATTVDRIFTDTLVNDPADALTPKRLAVLSYGASALQRLGDFSRLQA
jgi:glycyl-tRNA synthetase beta chain